MFVEWPEKNKHALCTPKSTGKSPARVTYHVVVVQPPDVVGQLELCGRVQHVMAEVQRWVKRENRASSIALTDTGGKTNINQW